MKKLFLTLSAFTFVSSIASALPYRLELAVPASGEDIFIEVAVPNGITPSALSHEGIFDEVNRTMKWGPLPHSGVSSVGFELTSGSGSLVVSSFPTDATTANSITLLADSDGDGLSDSFESTYGVTIADADDDQDGFDNLAEQKLGTNPKDSTSRLFARSVVERPDAESLEIRIPAEIGIAGLKVESSPSLTDPLWRSLSFTTAIEGDEIVIGVELEDLGGNKNFFRVLR